MIKVVSGADFAANFSVLIPNCVAFVDGYDVDWNGVWVAWFFCSKFPSRNGTIIKVS